MVRSFIKERKIKDARQSIYMCMWLPTMSNRKLALSFTQPQAAQAQDERSRLSLRNMTFAIRCAVLQGSRFTSLLRSRSQGRHAKLLPTTLNGCVGDYRLKKSMGNSL